MIRVGITGGIGSGKTYICNLFKQLNVPVYNADERAKFLMNNNPELKQKISTLFGDEAYIDNQLNRPHIAKLVFNNKTLLQQLNEIVHPAVAKDAEQWHQQHINHPYTIKEAALLFETGSYQQLDKTILVHAEEDERIFRVMQRDKVSKENVLDRIKHQMDDLSKMSKADFIINNNGQNELTKIVHKIHDYFSKVAVV